ncbi:TolC family protein [Massilia sp. LjRoot122]|uniref:TolC family protein n=1 Tax=Massilia sp. LjRoot122 TaxID=3342257 RepID=UPI003ECDDE07
MHSVFMSRAGVPARAARSGPAVFVALLLLLSRGASAGADGLTLDQALALASSVSASAKAARASVAASEHAAARADQLPDPTLKLGIDNLPVTGPDRFRPTADFMTMRRIGIEQQWVSRGKRQARTELARRSVEAVEAIHLDKLAAIRVETGKAWMTVLHKQRALALTRSIAREMESELAALQAAHRGAKASASDVLQARAELLLGGDDVEAAEQDLETALLQLRRWTRTDAMAVSNEAPKLDTALSRSAMPDLDRMHPAVLNARRSVDLADADAGAAIQESRPDWSFEAGFAQRGAQFSNMVSFGVSIPLSIHRSQRQDREIAEKAALGTRARLEYEEALLETRSSVEARLGQLDSLKRRIARLEKELLPTAARQVEIALAGYRGGTGTLSAVFKARRAALERRLQVNALELEAAMIWAELELRLIPQDMASTGRAGQ